MAAGAGAAVTGAGPGRPTDAASERRPVVITPETSRRPEAGAELPPTDNLADESRAAAVLASEDARHAITVE